MNFDSQTIRKFWAKVNIGPGCWEWIAGADWDGYGAFHVNGTQWRAHRLSWCLHFGAIPSGLCVCHHCDNPRCVNPSHLFIGSHRENTRDAFAKGRRAVGSRVTNSKLDEADVAQILMACAAGESNVKIARRFGISSVMVGHIKRGTSWAHVPRKAPHG